MKKYLFIVLLVGFCFGQDSYPFFSDPNKQIEFEEKRFYIIEKSGKEMHYSGGESYTELANTLGYILLDESPKYVVKQTPIKTHYTYFYDFKIKRGTKILTELEFLFEAGYEAKAKEVFSIYENVLAPYRSQLADYRKKLDYFNKNNRITTSKETNWDDETAGGCYNTVIGCYAMMTWPLIAWAILDDDFRDVIYFEDEGMWLPVIAIINVMSMFPIKGEKKVNSLPIPQKPVEPTLKQALANEQIKSLAEAYNRRLYKEIQNK